MNCKFMCTIIYLVHHQGRLLAVLPLVSHFFISAIHFPHAAAFVFVAFNLHADAGGNMFADIF